MVIGSVICFAVAAVGGMILAALGKADRKLPFPLSIIHGLVAAAGLILLLVGVIQDTGNTAALISLILFVVAALGGFVLFSFHLRSRKHPFFLVGVHGLVAVVAFVILLTTLF